VALRGHYRLYTTIYTTIGGTTTLKFGRAINVQNSARFRTTFDFDHKYPKKRSRYRPRDTNYIESNSCCIGQKIGKLLFTNKKSYRRRCWPTQVQNSARFRATSNFDREYNYLERINIPKIDIKLDRLPPSRVEPKQFGELWSTNKQAAGTDIDKP